MISQKYSHAEEVEERLGFFRFYASVSDFSIRKDQLKVIYDLLATGTALQSDQFEFLTWCKGCCEGTNTNSKQILDLTEVGEFFNELIQNKSL